MKEGVLITQIQIHLKNLFLKRKEILLDSDILENILKAVIKLKKKKYLKKIEALNYLDKILENKKFKYTYKLNKGDYVILNNNVIAHGRSSFKIEKIILGNLLGYGFVKKKNKPTVIIFAAGVGRRLGKFGKKTQMSFKGKRYIDT